MMDSQLVLYEEDHRKILTLIGRLVREANAKGVFVVDKNGQAGRRGYGLVRPGSAIHRCGHQGPRLACSIRAPM
jgi:hypothetical protein